MHTLISLSFRSSHASKYNYSKVNRQVMSRYYFALSFRLNSTLHVCLIKFVPIEICMTFHNFLYLFIFCGCDIPSYDYMFSLPRYLGMQKMHMI